MKNPIFKNLPHRYAKTISNKLNCSQRHVYNVVSGKSKDKNIEIALLEMVVIQNKLLKRKERLIEKLKA